MEFDSDLDAFERICGDCCGVNIKNMTSSDVKNQAEVWIASGEPCSPELIEAAIRVLTQYQAQA